MCFLVDISNFRFLIDDFRFVGLRPLLKEKANAAQASKTGNLKSTITKEWERRNEHAGCSKIPELFEVGGYAVGA